MFRVSMKTWYHGTAYRPLDVILRPLPAPRFLSLSPVVGGVEIVQARRCKVLAAIAARPGQLRKVV